MSTTEIAATNRAFEEAVRKGDVDRLAYLYTTDAMALPPDGPIVKGREELRARYGTMLASFAIWHSETCSCRRSISRSPATPRARSARRD